MHINWGKIKRKLLIRTKLILINIPLIIIPIIVFSIVIANIYDDAMVKRTRRNVEDSNVVIADRIMRVLTDSQNCANYLTVNINRIISNQYQKTSNLNEIVINRLITNELNSAQVIFNEIESITYITKEKIALYSDYRLMNNVEKIMTSDYYNQLQETSGNSIWFPATVRDYLVINEEKQVLTLGKKIISTSSGETMGYLFVNINIEEIVKHLDNQLIQYWLIDNEGNTLSARKEVELLNQVDAYNWINQGGEKDIIPVGNHKYLLSKYQVGDSPWTLFATTDLNEFNVDVQNALTLITIVTLSLCMLIVVMSIIFTSIITAPLDKLKKGAEEIGMGNLSIRFAFKTEDEIGQLGKSFNYMSKKVEELIQKVDCESRKKREYELSLLQQQVKPHFLYNTLDIIIKLSAMNKNREAQRVAKKLADYYRGSLSNRKEVITIGEEIQIIRDYLELQKMRYSDLFEYSIEVEQEVEYTPILKLTLQPLVENAIYHGLKYKGEKGNLVIRGVREGDMVRLYVIDDGIGMKEELSNLDYYEEQPYKHFGVYSVNHRIRLYFGEEYGLAYESEIGIGTKAQVTLPYREEGWRSE